MLIYTQQQTTRYLERMVFIMKKMTSKEFKKVFEDAGFDFEVWGYEGILDLVAVAVRSQAIEAENRGAVTVPKRCRERADYIENTLRERGYYNS